MKQTPESPERDELSKEVADALQQGVIYHERGELAQAEAFYARVLEAEQENVHALRLLGLIRYAQGLPQQAVELISTSVRIKPDFAEAHAELGNLLQALNRHEEAIGCYQKALVLKPDLAQAHNNLGVALQALNRLEEAVASYQKALTLKPEYAEAHYSLGATLQAQDRYQEAIGCYEKALALVPDDAQAHNNLGVALQALNRLEEAVASYQKALALEPAYAEAHHNLGTALQALDRYEEAIGCYEKALVLKPDLAEAHNNLGVALQALNRHAEAVASYEKTLALKPDLAEAHWNEALALLSLGDFHRGWTKFEWRWQTKNFPSPRRNFPQRHWQGENLEGKTILLHAEQGFGDTIQFVRYAPLVAARGGRVILEIQAELKGLICGLPRIEKVISKGEAPPDFDVHCPLLSLPLIFASTLETIPSAVPYLQPLADRVTKWSKLLGHAERLQVGITWSGRPTYGKTDYKRSIPLALLAPLLGTPGARFVGLQKDIRQSDAATLDTVTDFLTFSEELGDFSDTAALLSVLDLVISIDTAVAHLAGALGKPCWTLLPFSADWRWLIAREDSPWYPTMRLFRQPAIGDWQEVLRRIEKELSGEIGRHFHT